MISSQHTTYATNIHIHRYIWDIRNTIPCLRAGSFTIPVSICRRNSFQELRAVMRIMVGQIDRNPTKSMIDSVKESVQITLKKTDQCLHGCAPRARKTTKHYHIHPVRLSNPTSQSWIATCFVLRCYLIEHIFFEELVSQSPAWSREHGT